ncbi:amino acid permease [Hirsutella rhossiliensis]|uniref:Amino acid permease domain-containing protein n=1 Tax=Hirsutella rhossiliensis TaxID=111463 RepID=A0A9P8SNT8_9HYPO|nr:amino acid permease domain-containing protein [Hirsutella rhossiliensis]KAH0967491.1 amino acid permease domain-containing protein [Hirsutella rhossiliensis]
MDKGRQQQQQPRGRSAGAMEKARGDDKAGGNDDEAALERLGHKQELKRNFSTVSMLGLAFAIVNTWPALAAALNVALPSGGTSSVIWGLVTAGLCNLCLAASLAEFLSAFPTAGGQYHWAAIVAWERSSRAVSYVTGWINVAGWVAVSASGGLLGTTFVVNVVSLLRPGYEAQPWHQFLIYVALTLLALSINAFFTRLLPYFTKAAFYWSIGGFVVISITVLACASPDYQSGGFVYGHFINEVGWPDGQAWLLGLLQGAWALTGFDATAHMIEEIPEPHVQGPRIMLYCIFIGVFTGFVFLSALLFCVKDIERVINAPYGPLLQIFMDATKSPAGSTCLLMIPTIGIVFTLTTLMCASSRMSYAFARDRGMPFSSVFARVHPGLDVPLNALLWTAAWVIVFGCIFLGSTSTFNAITAASVVALGITYAIPPAINVLRGRKMLPENRSFKLPEALGWTVNLVGILWTILTTVLFVFPPKVPVTASNMNYCIVAFGIILLIAVLTWILDGRKHYKGPKLDVQGLVEGKVEGIEGDAAQPAALPSNKASSDVPMAEGNQ